MVDTYITLKIVVIVLYVLVSIGIFIYELMK